jgi:hypothetical protein
MSIAVENGNSIFTVSVAPGGALPNGGRLGYATGVRFVIDTILSEKYSEEASGERPLLVFNKKLVERD